MVACHLHIQLTNFVHLSSRFHYHLVQLFLIVFILIVSETLRVQHRVNLIVTSQPAFHHPHHAHLQTPEAFHSVLICPKLAGLSTEWKAAVAV